MGAFGLKNDIGVIMMFDLATIKSMNIERGKLAASINSEPYVIENQSGGGTYENPRSSFNIQTIRRS